MWSQEDFQTCIAIQKTFLFNIIIIIIIILLLVIFMNTVVLYVTKE